MSYAHEIFGVRETRHDIWMQDLLLAGTSSATFNSDRMREIAASPFVKDNGWAGYYLLLWCKYNNVPIPEVMRLGQKVAVRNSDYGTVDNYILVTLANNTAYFVSEGYVAYMPAINTNSTFYNGNPDESFIGAWLKAETPNWHPEIVYSAKGLGALGANYGYSHGVPEELLDIIKQNTIGPNYFFPVINDTPNFLWNDWYPLGFRNEFGNTAIYTAKIISNGVLGDKMSIGHTFWSPMLPAQSTQGMAHPLLAPTWSEVPQRVATLALANALTYKDLNSNEDVVMSDTAFPSLNRSAPHLARFNVTY